MDPSEARPEGDPPDEFMGRRMRVRLHWAARRQISYSEYQKSDGFMTITGDPFSAEFTDVIYKAVSDLKGWAGEQWLLTSLTVIASEPEP